MKRELVFDIETDGLVSTRVWCICAIDINTGQEYTFGPDELQEGYAFLHAADKLVGHNIIGFDKSIPKFIDTSSEEAKFPSVIISKDRRPTL